MKNILVRPIGNRIIVDIFDQGEIKLNSGIIVSNDDFKDRGIRPRRATVLAIGKDVHDVSVGDVVLISHADWSRKFKSPCDDGTVMWTWMTDEDKILSIIEE